MNIYYSTFETGIVILKLAFETCFTPLQLDKIITGINQ